MSEDNIEYLSSAAYQKLSDELERRKTVLRNEITQRIAAARAEGDLKENGGYHAARDEQGKNEGRIKELEFRLENSVVITDQPGEEDDDQVLPGKLIEVEMNNSGKITKFVLGSRENADEDNDIAAYTPQSPIGSAVLNHHAGETVKYKAPNGRDITVKIISAKF